MKFIYLFRNLIKYICIFIIFYNLIIFNKKVIENFSLPSCEIYDNIQNKILKYKNKTQLNNEKQLKQIKTLANVNTNKLSASEGKELSKKLKRKLGEVSIPPYSSKSVIIGNRNIIFEKAT